METQNQLNEIWKSNKVAQPNIATIIHKAKKYRINELIKTTVVLIIFFVTTLFMYLLWTKVNFDLKTTKIGLTIMLGSICLFSIVYATNGLVLYKLDKALPNTSYLNQLIKIKEKQLFIHNIVIPLYFILLSIGTGLYSYEFIQKMEVLLQSIFISFLVVWFGFIWFYTRPVVQRKQQATINKLIHNFEETLKSV